MLMFQNGLLATFIPEICMVLGYILCLIAPGFKPDNTTVQQTQTIEQVSLNENSQLSVYHLTYSDFQTATEFETKDKYTPLTFNTLVINATPESVFSTTDGQRYVDFSRPPPTYIL